MSGKRGFTLVELLVVIAIIAVLAAVLFPVFARVKERGRAIGCMSNSRQIGIAIGLYAAENRDRYPLARMMMSGPMHSSATWLDTVQPYTQSRLLHRCPSDTSALWDAAVPAEKRETSYGINGYFTPNHPPYWGLHSGQITYPCATVVVAEMVFTVNKDHFMPMFWGNPPKVANPMIQTAQWNSSASEPKTVAIRIHQGGANYVFADGHARWMQFADTWGPDRDFYDPRRH